MGNFKRIKRKFLVRLMSVLGFGGMAAFCVSCQPVSPNNNNDKTSKQESSDAQISAPQNTPQDATPQNDNQKPDPGVQAPGDEQDIPDSPSPDVEPNDEIQVPPAPQPSTKANDQTQHKDLSPTVPPKEYGIKLPMIDNIYIDDDNEGKLNTKRYGIKRY